MGTRACKHECSMSTPSVGEAGETGDWRSLRPVVDPKKCLAAKSGKETCFQCWAFCPEGVVARAIGCDIDLLYCKGCGICAEVCPADAISMEPETDFS